VSATPQEHHICFQMSSLRIERRVAGRTLGHLAPEGGLSICPAGADFFADADESGTMLLVAIKPSQLKLAAAESSAFHAQLLEQLSVQDEMLFNSARALATESAAGYPSGRYAGTRLRGSLSTVSSHATCRCLGADRHRVSWTTRCSAYLRITFGAS
jgi:hypothetical protein